MLARAQGGGGVGIRNKLLFFALFEIQTEVCYQE
jgi:hypothetical protein